MSQDVNDLSNLQGLLKDVYAEPKKKKKARKFKSLEKINK